MFDAVFVDNAPKRESSNTNTEITRECFRLLRAPEGYGYSGCQAHIPDAVETVAGVTCKVEKPHNALIAIRTVDAPASIDTPELHEEIRFRRQVVINCIVQDRQGQRPLCMELRIREVEPEKFGDMREVGVVPVDLRVGDRVTPYDYKQKIEDGTIHLPDGMINTHNQMRQLLEGDPEYESRLGELLALLTNAKPDAKLARQALYKILGQYGYHYDRNTFEKLKTPSDSPDFDHYFTGV